MSPLGEYSNSQKCNFFRRLFLLVFVFLLVLATVDSSHNLKKLENWPSKDLPVFISVGYMFRYSKAVQKMKQLVDQYCNGQVKACLARYNCAYDTITKRHFWDVQANVSPFWTACTNANECVIVQAFCACFSFILIEQCSGGVDHWAGNPFLWPLSLLRGWSGW